MQGLGERIRDLRKKRGLKILDMTAKTGIDKATLSRIENGKMRGTITAHLKIAEALGVPLPELYEEVLNKQDEPSLKSLKEKVETFSHSSGAIAELLTSGPLQKKMMAIRLKIKEGGHTETEEYPLGTERVIYSLRGTVTLHVGDEVINLKKDEMFYFNATKPHHFENRTKKDISLFSILTPASL